MIQRLRALLLPTARVPALARFYKSCYAASLCWVVADLRRDPAIHAIVMRSAFTNPWFRPLVSDIDLLIICGDAEDLDSCRRRIQHRLKRWKRRLPHFKGGWICSESRLREGENDVVLNYVLLDDAVSVCGGFDASDLRHLYQPGRSIARYIKAAWWYAEEVNRLLHLPIHVRRQRNGDKVLAKALVYAGYGWDESRAAVETLFGGLGAAAAVEDMEAALRPFLMLLKTKLRDLPFVRRPEAFRLRVDGCPRPMPTADTPPVVNPEVEEAIASFRRCLDPQAPCPSLRVYRATDGSSSLVTFAVLDEQDLQPRSLQALASAWRRLTAKHPAAAELLCTVPPHPIVVDEEMLRLCLLLNVLECHRTWQAFLQLESTRSA